MKKLWLTTGALLLAGSLVGCGMASDLNEQGQRTAQTNNWDHTKLYNQDQNGMNQAGNRYGVRNTVDNGHANGYGDRAEIRNRTYNGNMTGINNTTNYRNTTGIRNTTGDRNATTYEGPTGKRVPIAFGGYGYGDTSWFGGTSGIRSNNLVQRIDYMNQGRAGVLATDDDEHKGYFDDVPADRWSSEAVEWAKDAGLMSGMGGAKFAPGQALTREQMAQVLYNLAEAGYIGAEEEPAEEPAAEEPVVEEPVAEELAAEEPAAEEPAAEEPAAEAPATEEPVAEAPATEEPAGTTR